MKVELMLDKPEFTAYSKSKDPIILFTAFDRQDNNKFRSDMTKVITKLAIHKLKISPVNIALHSGYGLKEIELNLYEIEQIMNALDV